MSFKTDSEGVLGLYNELLLIFKILVIRKITVMGLIAKDLTFSLKSLTISSNVKILLLNFDSAQQFCDCF